jgi:hypothetical protein
MFRLITQTKRIMIKSWQMRPRNIIEPVAFVTAYTIGLGLVINDCYDKYINNHSHKSVRIIDIHSHFPPN